MIPTYRIWNELEFEADAREVDGETIMVAVDRWLRLYEPYEGKIFTDGDEVSVLVRDAEGKLWSVSIDVSVDVSFQVQPALPVKVR
jgi:hypothetical protein